ncbi:MAG: dihydrodipicolinate synthase family protein, partial [bacterium]|jgi:4-hydroxy-tetrahydrodipicolinate synthase
MMAVGARGVVSVAGNVAPGLLSGMVKAFLEGRPDEARDFHLRLLPLFHVLFIETNPGPVKAAVEMLGLGTGELRLPLVPVSEASREKVRGVMHDLGIMRQGL